MFERLGAHDGAEQQRRDGDIQHEVVEPVDRDLREQPRPAADHPEGNQPEDGQDDGEDGGHELTSNTFCHVMPGLDPGISHRVSKEMRGSSPRMTIKGAEYTRLD